MPATLFFGGNGYKLNFSQIITAEIMVFSTNDRALFARFARSNINFQEPGNGDTKLSGKGRGEDTCYMSHVILAKLET